MAATLAWLAWAGSATADDDEIRAATLVRTDSDGTQVVSPSARGRVQVLDEDTHFDVEYVADVWTSASIDVRTAATLPVTEQRDEVDVGLDRRFEDVLVRGSYRYSAEHDYQSHGGTLSGSADFADHNTTLELRLTAQHDTIGRSGDPLFQRPQTVFGGRAAYTQVIDPNMLVQAAYDLVRVEGFQSSPYRFVGIGGDGRCAGTAQLCVPETHPDARTRHAIVVRARRALDDQLSLHADYRFYADDWGLLAHTAAVQVSWMHDERGLFALRYRFHDQGAAAFYRSSYPMPTFTLLYASRDRELSPLTSHRVSLAYEREFELGEAGPPLRVAVALGGTSLDYHDFVGLSQVLAGDATLSLSVEL